MDEVPVTVALAVTVEGPAVTASLTFRNVSSKDVFLDPLMACADGKVRHKVFLIQSGGKDVRYLLPLAKRRPTPAEDLIRLPPGGTLVTRARLDEAYGFFPGSHSYRAVYSAFHDQPGDDLYELVSEAATFVVNHQG